MSKEESKIPTNRLSRFGQMASLATKIGSNVVAEGTKQWMKGNKPSKQASISPGVLRDGTSDFPKIQGCKTRWFAAWNTGKCGNLGFPMISEPRKNLVINLVKPSNKPSKHQVF